MASSHNFGGRGAAPVQTHLAPLVPGDRHDFMLSLTDFNHTAQLPASTLLKYAGDARLQAFATWPALARMMQEDLGAELVVKAHLIRFLKPNKSHPASLISVTQTPHAVGATTLTMAYEFFEGADTDAFAQVLTVCVRVKDGSSLPLPSYVADEVMWRHKATELENTKDLVLFSTAIDRARGPSAVTSSMRVVHEVLVRPSDLGRTHTVTRTRMAQFFEDAVGGSKVPDVVYIEYLHELKAKARCEVVCVPNSESGGTEMISFLIDSDTRESVARTYMSWANKTLRDEPDVH